MNAIDLSSLLWRERQLLESYESALTHQLHLISSGKIESIEMHEAEVAARRLGEVRLERDIRVSALAKHWGVAGEASLQSLAQSAPPGPWRYIFSSHDEAITQKLRDIESLKESIARVET